MPCLSIRFDATVGPLMQLAVAPPGAGAQFAQGVVAPGQAQPAIFTALVDTGASTTCIAADVAASAGLPLIGMRQMTSATHSQVPVPLYLGDLLIPFGPVIYIVPAHQMMEFGSGGPFQALLGRDVICQGALALSFDGHMTFSL